MKGRIEAKIAQENENSFRLEQELSRYEQAGVQITVEGYEVDINKRLTDMLLRDGPCTYMRNYSFNEEGQVTVIAFEKVRL